MLLAAPLAALAQPAPAEATDPVPVVDTGELGWSLGAGVGWMLVSSTVSFATTGLLPPRAPGAVASLERRLGPDTWLALGVYGRIEATKIETGSGGPEQSRTDVREGAVTFGLRQVVTRPRAPLTVSLLVVGSAAEASSETDPDPIFGTRLKARATSFGAAVGLAVDRELTPGLSLRLATGLAGASWSTSRTMNYDPGLWNPWVRSRGWFAGVQLSPSLELRLAF